MDDRFDARHGGGKGVGLEDVAPDAFDPRMAGEGVSAFGMAGEEAHSVAEGEEFFDHFASHKPGAACNENHRTFLAAKLRRWEIVRKIGAGHAERDL